MEYALGIKAGLALYSYGFRKSKRGFLEAEVDGALPTLGHLSIVSPGSGVFNACLVAGAIGHSVESRRGERA